MILFGWFKLNLSKNNIKLLCSNLSFVHYQDFPNTLLLYVLAKRICLQAVEPAKYVITQLNFSCIL